MLHAALLLTAAAFPPPAVADRPDLVLLVADALRADVLGCYGHPGMLSAHLDRLARSGRQLSEVRSPSPWTLPALASAFSGRPPHATGALGHLDTVSPELPLLAEGLRRDGYRTLGVSANFIYGSPASGLGRGFDRFDVLTVDPRGRLHVGKGDARTWAALGHARPAPAASLAAHALRLLAEVPAPRFLHVHLMDTHWPYHRAWPGALGGHAPESLRDAPADRRRRYLDAVPGLDAEVGRLRRALPSTARLVFTSDHGEELGERGGVDHGHSLHEELLRIPAILAGPGVEAGLDATPRTLTELGGALRDGSWPVAAARIAERDNGTSERAIYAGEIKLRVGPDGNTLYDLDADPGERAPRRRVPDAAVAPVLGLLRRSEAPVPGTPLSVPEEALRALGYLR